MDVECPCDEDGEPIRKKPGAQRPTGTGKAEDNQLVAGADVADAHQGTAEEEKKEDAADDAAGGVHPYDLDAEPALVPEGEIAFDYEDPMSVRFNPEAEDADDAYEMFVAKLLGRRRRRCRHFGVKEIRPRSAGGDEGDRQMYADPKLASAAAGSGWLGGQNILGSQLGALTGRGARRSRARDRVLPRRQDRPAVSARPALDLDQAHEGVAEEGSTRRIIRRTAEADATERILAAADSRHSRCRSRAKPQAMGVLAADRAAQRAADNTPRRQDQGATRSRWRWAGSGSSIPADKRAARSTPTRRHASAHVEGLRAREAAGAERSSRRSRAEVYQRARRADGQNPHWSAQALGELSFGKTPAGVTAGRPMRSSMQEEVTDSVLTPDLEAFEMAYEEAGRRMLVLAQKHYREERKIQIRGERGEWEVRSFDGSDLIDGLDVRVQVGSSFPWSKNGAVRSRRSTCCLESSRALCRSRTAPSTRRNSHEMLDVTGSGLDAFESDENPDLVEVQREHAMFEAYWTRPRTRTSRRRSRRLPQLA